MFRRPISSFNKLTANINSSTPFINDIKGEIKNINHQKLKTQINHSKLLVSLNSSTNFRNLLSNETSVEYPGNELSDFSICLIWLLIITIVIISLKCFLRNREDKKEKEKEKNKQTKNNELFDKARVDLENNILNSKSFSFIPISSPINLENIKTPISGDEIIDLDQNVKDELVVKAPKRLKIELKVDFINSFTLKSEIEKLDV